MPREGGCPYCRSYDIDRLYMASVRLDWCRCRHCEAGWDEDVFTGEFRGRAERQSAVIPRDS